ncbi:hypothetical protein Tsubulata_029870 [Turnera subulata]|uniref:Protein kinase domain-containing protein n=1 Tax=Turnera subulata TaxID=218843 RepID=A0A9Q0IZJ5_9ROSI|nr:hypothetical protein Tsubulata_029870 [Turnera subulata]
MEKPVYHPYKLLLLMLLVSLHHSDQLQPSQSQSLVRILQFLHNPLVPGRFNNYTDFCNTEPTPSLTIVCYEDNVTQLHIIGNNGVPPLAQNFSSISFFDSVASISNLKVLSLVSLGLWGPLPSSIGQLSSLEILNVSSNYFSGAIPPQLSYLKSLQTLILDHNNFTGEVPGWLSSLHVLAVLSLKGNSLGGSLPNSMERLENLRVLSVSKNHLSGQVPSFSNLTNLQVLELEDNRFGPYFPSLHHKLVSIVLRNNSFQFGIPPELANFHQLQKLDLSLNGFVGPFSPSLLSLPSMKYLDVSQNKLTGMLFENTSCSVELSYVDLSSNLLTGDLPACLKSGSNSTVVQYASNCLSNEDEDQHPPKFCHNEALAVTIMPHGKDKHERPCGRAIVASSTTGGIVGAIAIVSLVFLVVRRIFPKVADRKPAPTRLIRETVSTVNTVKLLSDARHISETMKLGASLSAYRTFSLEELKEATNNFDIFHLLAESSPSQVYSGQLADGTSVAIKSLKVKKKNSQPTFKNLIELMSKLRHNHLVSALGHCFEDSFLDEPCISRIFLVFEFVPNGTLRDYTSGFPAEKRLTWTQRIGAAIGVARGIQFLHTGIVPGTLSINLKITDVFLDQDLHVKICSYNLPLLAENMEMVSTISAFLRPKKTSRTREKHDQNRQEVYDFGVILMEMIVGRPVMSENEVSVSKAMLQRSMTPDDTARSNVVDEAVHKGCSEESLKIMMELCIRCLAEEPSGRPSMEDVLWNLQFAAQADGTRKGGLEDQYSSGSFV